MPYRWEMDLSPGRATKPLMVLPGEILCEETLAEGACCINYQCNETSGAERLPTIIASRKIGDIPKPCAPQNTGGNRTAIPALAMDNDEFAAVQLACSPQQLS